MLSLEDKNSDFLHVGDSIRTNSYYDIDINFEKTEVFGTDALDQAIENLIFTEYGERHFNCNFGSPLHDILFEKNTDADIIKERVYKAIESIIPISIQRNTADIGTSEDDPHIFYMTLDYNTNDGLVVGHHFNRKFKF